MQTADLLRNAAQALGVTTAKLDEVLQWQRHLVGELSQLRERIKALENDKEWNGEERRDVRERLKSGDHTFLRIEEIAKQAERTAESAKLMLKEVLQRKSDGTRKRSKWIEILKIAAPYVFPAVISAIGALWVYFKSGGGHP